MRQTNRGPQYALRALVEVGLECAVVTARRGRIRISWRDLEERDAILRLFQALAAEAPLPDFEGLESLFDALIDMEAVIRGHEIWMEFDDASTNPPRYDNMLSAEAAYELPKWSFSGAIAAEFSAFDLIVAPPGVNARTRSLDLSVQGRSPTAKRAVGAVVGALATQPNGHTYYSSAGGMWPISAAVLVPSAEGPYEHFILDQPSSAVYVAEQAVSQSVLCSCFVPDPSLDRLLSDGALAVACLFADPQRICGKYGNRGWHYALIETGMVGARLEQISAANGMATRMIGGYYSTRLIETLGAHGLRPTLTVVISEQVENSQ